MASFLAWCSPPAWLDSTPRVFGLPPKKIIARPIGHHFIILARSIMRMEATVHLYLKALMRNEGQIGTEVISPSI